MNWVGATTRARASMTVVIVAAMLSGCTATTAGLAVRDLNAAPIDVSPLKKSQLDGVLLNLAELNSTLGATRLEFVIDGEAMSDNSNAVSDPDCLGSVLGAEETVYRSSGWTAVRDQAAREPGNDNKHWVEQVVVLYPSETLAKDFVDTSTSRWRDCGGFSVAVDNATTSSIWLIGGVSVDDEVVTQRISQGDSDGWECEHALTAVSNVSIETLACAFGIAGEAVTMAQKLVANAARK